LMQLAAATDRKVKAKTADAQTALVVAKEELTELEELRKLRKVWGERSKVPLKEQVAESKQKSQQEGAGDDPVRSAGTGP